MQVCGEAFGCCGCSSNSCWVFRDLAALSISCGAKLKSSEGQSWKFSVLAFNMGVIFVPLLAMVCLGGAFGETCTVRGWKKGWRCLLQRCFFLEKMLAQHLSGVSLGVLAEAPEGRHSETAVPQHLRSRLRCCM